MKIVNVVDEFYPGAGYENNILSKYFVKFGYKYTILSTQVFSNKNFFNTSNYEIDDKVFEKETGVAVKRLPVKRMISGRAIWNFKEFIITIKSINPDVIFFCGNDSYIAIRYLFSKWIKKTCVVMDSHMLEMASHNRFRKLFWWFYRHFCAPKIIKYAIPVIRLQDDLFVQRRLGIPLSQSPFISFGTDTLLFHPDKNIKKGFRDENKLSDNAFIVVYAGKLDEAKGGQFFADTILEKFNTERELVFVIVGNTFGDYGIKVEKTFAQSENKILRYPTQKYSDLAQYFQIADLVLFPKQCSLSFYDAEACGAPVLSEDNNVNVDRCSHNNGWNYKAGDIEDFRNKIVDIANMDADELETVSNNAYNFIKENYDYEKIAREFEKIIMASYERKQG